jgi:hypothetical protein
MAGKGWIPQQEGEQNANSDAVHFGNSMPPPKSGRNPVSNEDVSDGCNRYCTKNDEHTKVKESSGKISNDSSGLSPAVTEDELLELLEVQIAGTIS